MNHAIKFAIENEVKVLISPSEGLCVVTLEKNGYSISLEVDSNDTDITIDGAIYKAILDLEEEIKKGNIRYES